MKDVLIEDKLYSSISSYCSLNGIDDINDFINEVLSRGFMIMKNGYSPSSKVLIERGVDDNVTNATTSSSTKQEENSKPYRKVKITVKKKTKDD